MCTCSARYNANDGRVIWPDDAVHNTPHDLAGWIKDFLLDCCVHGDTIADETVSFEPSEWALILDGLAAL